MRILLVEDESLFAEAVAKRLRREGHHCLIAGSIREAQTELAATAGQLDLLLLDERLPDGRGVELMQRHAAPGADRLPPVIVMTAFADVEHAVATMKLGAIDYLRKPVDLDAVVAAVARAAETAPQRRSGGNRQPDGGEADLIGEAPALQAARARIDELASIGGNGGTAPPTVLIFGETGAGKDLAARRLHACGARAGEPFVQIDCATLPKELIEAELFGHEKGAFTGARQQRQGLIAAAGAGTLFLDEIGELSLDLQTKLLAVLDRRRLRRVGSNKESPVRARFIAATNRDLAAMVAEGRFRADLLFRLNVLTLVMPPLRHLPENLPALVQLFSERAAQNFGRAAPTFSDAAMAKLRGHGWPGNVRELKHVIEKAVLLNKGVPVAPDDIELFGEGVAAIGAADGGELPDLTLEEAEKQLIERALQRAGGNVSEAARLLDTTRMTLRYRMEKHAIDAAGLKEPS